MSSVMRQRFLSTLGLWLGLILIIALFGAAGAVWAMTLLAVLALREFYSLLRQMGQPAHDPWGLGAALVIMLGDYYLLQWTGIRSGAEGLFIFSSILVFTLAMRRDHQSAMARSMPTVLGLLLVPLMLTGYIGMLKLAGNEVGLMLAVWTIAVAKFTDVGALLVGKTWGRTPFAPILSPRKTWEGVVGGLVCGVGMGVLLKTTVPWLPESMTLLDVILIAFCVGVASIASDLFESTVKREAGVKDSGNVIPGIGGAFDLVDSLLFSAPVSYYLMAWLVF